MRKLFLYMTMSLDGFIAGPNNDLDWIEQSAASDPDLNEDIVTLISGADTGIMGYPTAVGMIPYWANMAKDPSASRSDHDIAQAVDKIHAVIISKKPEKLEGGIQKCS